MKTHATHAEKLNAAREFLNKIKPRNPPIIGIYRTDWPVGMERLYPTVRQAEQAMRVNIGMQNERT
jgi:hypothetical protein